MQILNKKHAKTASVREWHWHQEIFSTRNLPNSIFFLEKIFENEKSEIFLAIFLDKTFYLKIIWVFPS